MSVNNPTITETIRGLFTDGTLLVRQEIELAKLEASEKFEQIQIGVAAIAAGALIAFTALLVLVQALVAALSNIMLPSLAALIVGVILAIIAFVLVAKGQSNLKAQNLKPSRTMRTVQRNAETFKDAV